MGPNVPAGHPKQSLELVLPVLAVYVPTVHGVQSACPWLDHVPLGQFGHEEREYAENVPAAHRTHEADPELAEMRPKGHGVHWKEPGAEKSPAGQELHVADDVAETAADAVPAAQGKHVALDEAPKLAE